MGFDLPRLSSSERLALLIVAFVLLLAGGIYLFHPRWSSFSLIVSYESDTTSFRRTPYERRFYERFPSRTHVQPNESYSLFPFDPNLADSFQLRSLGLSPFIVRNILKYRAKGGVFRTRHSFARLYGLDQAKYQELYPYLQLPDTIRHELSHHPLPSKEPYSVKLQLGETLELNTADTTLLKRIPGIGSGYARMIIGYRRRLGGFVSVDQLFEVERLPDSVARSAQKYLTIVSDSIARLDLNTASIERMQAHPYLNFYQARTIFEHRRRHGSLRSLHQLRLYEEFTTDDLSRLAPYIQFETKTKF